ncbi:uncharacterized protein LOC142925150 isoform X2 [Petromyzon marinus]|uniref:uncharacterized protein LOC142925150 isoform X2 n=1 Tax=Petromyzon marinus TaxID=7757 RepID=UPI003F705B41
MVKPQLHTFRAAPRAELWPRAPPRGTMTQPLLLGVALLLVLSPCALALPLPQEPPEHLGKQETMNRRLKAIQEALIKLNNERIQKGMLKMAMRNKTHSGSPINQDAGCKRGYLSSSAITGMTEFILASFCGCMCIILVLFVVKISLGQNNRTPAVRGEVRERVRVMSDELDTAWPSPSRATSPVEQQQQQRQRTP